MTDQKCASGSESRWRRYRRDPWRVVMNVTGTDYCGNVGAPCDHYGFDRIIGKDLDDRYVYRTNEDAGTFWIGTPHEWHHHMGRKDARRMAWWILVRWWVWGEWFGLRRWVWFQALKRVCDRHRRWLGERAMP